MCTDFGDEGVFWSLKVSFGQKRCILVKKGAFWSSQIVNCQTVIQWSVNVGKKGQGDIEIKAALSAWNRQSVFSQKCQARYTSITMS